MSEPGAIPLKPRRSNHTQLHHTTHKRQHRQQQQSVQPADCMYVDRRLVAASVVGENLKYVKRRGDGIIFLHTAQAKSQFAGLPCRARGHMSTTLTCKRQRQQAVQPVHCV